MIICGGLPHLNGALCLPVCSVHPRWVGSSPGQDHGAQRARSRLLRHGVRGNRQGHHQRRPGHTSRRQDGERVGQPAREDRVPERSLRHEGFQLSPRGTSPRSAFQTLSQRRHRQTGTPGRLCTWELQFYHIFPFIWLKPAWTCMTHLIVARVLCWCCHIDTQFDSHMKCSHLVSNCAYQYMFT